MPTNLNIVDIVPNSLSPGGTQIEITDTTAGTPSGQLIYTAPGDENSWAEVRIEAVNVTVTNYIIILQWGHKETNEAAIVKQVTALAGPVLVVDGRLLRGGMSVWARCNTVTFGAGTGSAINVYVRPSLVHRITDEATG